MWQDSPVCRQPSFRTRQLSVLQPLPHPRVLALSQGVRVAGGTKVDCSLGGLGAVAVGCPKATKGSVVPASCPPPCAAGVSPWFAACAGCARHLHRAARPLPSVRPRGCGSAPSLAPIRRRAAARRTADFADADTTLRGMLRPFGQLCETAPAQPPAPGGGH